MSQKNKKIKPTSFIKNLFKILKEPNSSQIISWQSDGQSFIIKDEQKFSQVLLPKYFKHKNLASFIRQLNMYDFHKLKENSLEFHHPLFQPENITVLGEIRRKVNTKRSQKCAISGLSKRLETFQHHQVELESALHNLEQTYNSIVEQNKQLIEELIQSRQREKTFQDVFERINSDKSDWSDDEENNCKDLEGLEEFSSL